MRNLKQSILFHIAAVVLLGVSLSSTLAFAEQKSVLKFKHFAYIFLGPGLHPQQDRADIKTKNFTFTTVGIDFNNKDQVIAVAKKLVAEGAQMIELCGGFGPVWIANVSEAINNQVPVGSVAYGPEARKPLVELLGDVYKK
jgi:Family of unknown function (DUF6506)